MPADAGELAISAPEGCRSILLKASGWLQSVSLQRCAAGLSTLIPVTSAPGLSAYICSKALQLQAPEFLNALEIFPPLAVGG